MNWKEIIAREFKVAFSFKSQPLLFRIVKWIIVVSLIWFFHDYALFPIILFLLLVLSLALHFYYRKKTNGWTKSYGLWKYERVFPVGE